MFSPQTKKIAVNAGLTAIIAGVATKYFFNDTDVISYYGMELSAPVAVGIGCGLGSVVGDFTSEQIIRRLKLSNQLFNSAELAVHVGVAGTASAGILYFGGIPMSNIPKAIGVGACSKLLGDYAESKLFDARTGIIGPVF